MVSLSRLTLKTKFYLIVGAAAAGFAAIGITTYSAVRGGREWTLLPWSRCSTARISSPMSSHHL